MSSQSIRYIANNPAIQHILTAPISELGLPDRVTLLVERAGIETFGYLIERSAAEMLKTRVRINENRGLIGHRGHDSS